MTTGTTTPTVLDTPIPASPKLSEFLVTDGIQDDDMDSAPATPPPQLALGSGKQSSGNQAVEGVQDLETPSIQMPDEATLAAAAAAAMAAAAAQGGLSGLEQQPMPDADINPADDLNSYLLAAAAASVHAQQQNGDELHKAQSEESFDSTATPVPNSIYTNGTSVNGSEEDDPRAVIQDQCHKYTGDSTPFPLEIGKRTPGGCAELLAQHGDVEKLDSLPHTEATVELGKARCYWALLSADHSKGGEPTGDRLQFVYLDPVLQQHMAEQASGLVGSNFYDYVHPEERARVLDDMQKIVESRTLFGSVTRCRYSRLPRIRELLGAVNPPRDPDADKYVEDDNFVAIDIVINWIGDGMLLCFFHAIIDKADDDNDEQHKSDWTNWCGTPTSSFSLRQCDTLWKQVKATPREPAADSGPLHVFQVIEAGVDGRVLLSWPPPRLFPSNVDDQSVTQSDTIAFQDGSYFADDFARLAQGVSIAPGSSSLSDANTSCTRRFRAKHTLTTEGKLRNIESVLIPYGSVILACFHTTFQQHLPSPDPKLVMQAHATLQAQTQRRKAEDEESQNASKKRQRTSEGSDQAQSSVIASPTLPTDPAAAASARPKLEIDNVAAKEPLENASPAPNGSHTHSGTQSTKIANGHAPKTPASKPKTESSGILANPSLLYASAPAKTPATPANTARTPSDRSSATPTQNGACAHAAAGADSPNSSQNKACTGCGKINSPEWRRGPSGHKTLCNACGLRYARSLTRRKKKKGKDGEVEFIEPTGDPSIVPKSRGGGGGSLPGVHRKNSKKRKEEEAAKAAAAAALAATSGASAPAATAATVTDNTPTARATSTAASSSPATATQSPATGTPASLPPSPAVNGTLKPAGPSASSETAKAEPAASTAMVVDGADASVPTLPTDPTHSMAVSIALDLMAHATSSVPSLDADAMSLPVSDAISRAIAATIGSTGGAGGLVTSQALSSASEAVPSITIPVADSAPATDLATANGKSNAVTNPAVADTPSLDLSHALTADAIRAAAQAAIAQGVGAAEQSSES